MCIAASTAGSGTPATVGDKPTLATVFQALHQAQHTGPVVIHFAQGHPQTVELPKEPERIKLDKGRKPA